MSDLYAVNLSSQASHSAAGAILPPCYLAVAVFRHWLKAYHVFVLTAVLGTPLCEFKLWHAGQYTHTAAPSHVQQ